jgi:hypothetical protein
MCSLLLLSQTDRDTAGLCSCSALGTRSAIMSEVRSGFPQSSLTDAATGHDCFLTNSSQFVGHQS